MAYPKLQISDLHTSAMEPTGVPTEALAEEVMTPRPPRIVTSIEATHE